MARSLASLGTWETELLLGSQKNERPFHSQHRTSYSPLIQAAESRPRPAQSTPSGRPSSHGLTAATAAVAISHSPAVPIGPAGAMALTHTDRSAFSHWSASSVGGLLGASALQHAGPSSSGVPRVAPRTEGAPRAPDAMQIEPSSAAAAAAASAASSSTAPPPPGSEAGPSGAQPGTSTDAQMSDAGAPARPARKHSDAPIRKLSVSLIDTYKLINQVRRRLSIGTAAVAQGGQARAAGGQAQPEPLARGGRPGRGPGRPGSDAAQTQAQTPLAAFKAPRRPLSNGQLLTRAAAAPFRYTTRSASGGNKRRRRRRPPPPAAAKRSARARSTMVRTPAEELAFLR